MWFLYILSWIALIMQAVFMTLGLAAGLYYIADLVEEYTVTAKRIIAHMITASVIVDIGLFVFERFPVVMTLGGLIGTAAQGIVWRSFPYVELSSPAFIFAVVMFFVNHYIAFDYFALHYYTLGEAMGYFTICLWMVPLALFVSLSANENVLPTVTDSERDNDDDSALGQYLSQRGKKYGLLSLLQHINNSVFPNKNKKLF